MLARTNAFWNADTPDPALMSLVKKYADTLSDLAPAGFYVGLRVGFSYPADELNLLPQSWVDFYTTQGLVMHDPAMRWVYSHTGVARWDELGLDDPKGVLRQAARYGLQHGAVACVLCPCCRGRRSFGLFARDDRPFTALELKSLLGAVNQLHKDSGLKRRLTKAEIEALRLQASGMRLKEICGELGISMTAVKARLANAKRKLGAQTPSQAAAIARSRGLL